MVCLLSSKKMNRRSFALCRRTERFIDVEYNLETEQFHPECVNEESSGVSVRITQNGRLVVYDFMEERQQWNF